MRDRSRGRAVDVMASGEKQGGAMENGEKWTVIVNAVIPHYFIPLTDSAVQGKREPVPVDLVDLYILDLVYRMKLYRYCAVPVHVHVLALVRQNW